MPAVRMSVHEWVIQHFRLGHGRPVSIFLASCSSLDLTRYARIGSNEQPPAA